MLERKPSKGARRFVRYAKEDSREVLITSNQEAQEQLTRLFSILTVSFGESRVADANSYISDLYRTRIKINSSKDPLSAQESENLGFMSRHPQEERMANRDIAREVVQFVNKLNIHFTSENHY